MKAALKAGLLVLGLALAVWFIHRAGPAEIYRVVKGLGWKVALIPLPFFVTYLFDTLGWYLAFGSRGDSRPRFVELFRLRWAAESVNTLVPSAYLGGEALKIHLLHKRGIAGLTASTSVVASKTCQVLSQVVMIGLGALLALVRLPAGTAGRMAMVAIAAAALGGAAALFLLQQRGMFSTLAAIASGLGLRFAFLAGRAPQLRQLDDRIYAFYRRDRGRFLECNAAYFLGWLTDAAEVYLVCALLGLPLDWMEAIAIESFIGVAKGVGIAVPGALGVQESGVVLLFGIFGLPLSAALAYAIIRRGRELLYVVVGGLLLSAEEISFKQLLNRAEHPSLAA